MFFENSSKVLQKCLSISYQLQNSLEVSPFFHKALCDLLHRLGGITPFGVFSEAFPGLKMWDTFACATAIFLTFFVISIAVLKNVPLTQGYRKEPLFHTKRRSG
jgi:hypothetical protein